MNKEKLEKIFEEAVSSINKIPENLQPKAFEIIVNMLLKSEALSNTEGNSSEIKGRITLSEEKELLGVLAEDLNIDKKIIQTIYDFSAKGKINIIAPLKGTNAEKQRNIAYLYLLEKINYEKQDWISALELVPQIEHYGINDGHFSENLEKEKGRILFTGIKRGKKYSLSPNGIAEAKKFLFNLIKTN